MAEFSDFDTHQITEFLYDSILPIINNKTNLKSDYKQQYFDRFLSLLNYSNNIIFYGAPGTGKTHLANQLYQVFLYNQLFLINEEFETLRRVRWEGVYMLALYINPSKSLSSKELIYNWLLKCKPDYASVVEQNIALPSSSSVSYYVQKVDESHYLLNDLGIQYVEENLYDQLLEIRNSFNPDVYQSKYLKFVTFHQSFAYEEFVEGTKPITNESGDVSYKVVDGVFKQICKQAELDSENKYLIIIDEITAC